MPENNGTAQYFSVDISVEGDPKGRTEDLVISREGEEKHGMTGMARVRTTRDIYVREKKHKNSFQRLTLLMPSMLRRTVWLENCDGFEAKE